MNDSNKNIKDSCTVLEEIAKKQREEALRQNIYNVNNVYDANHPNANQNQGGSDDPKNIKGKGTGKYLDTSGGGGYYDINGRPELGVTGRKAILVKNKYNKDNPYECQIN